MGNFATAELLVRLRAADVARPARLPPELAPGTEAEAYRIQAGVVARLGGRPAGYKASMPDATQGLSAPVLAGNLLQSPAAIAGLAHPTRGTACYGVEPEIAFRMGRALPPHADHRSYTRDEVLAAIDSAHAALEICACRVGDFHGGPPLERLADSIMNEGLVIGAPFADWRELDLRRLPLTLRLDGAVVHQDVGGHPLGDPLIPMVWMANHLAGRGAGLLAGDVVTTGSCAGLHELRPGHVAEAIFGTLGGVSLQA